MRELCRRGLAAILLTFPLAQGAQAAPFCVESAGALRECLYHDITQCKEAAARRGGFCTVNAAAVKTPQYAGAFCLMDSGMKPECHFPDGETCNQAARARNGVCFENVRAMTTDPYRLDRPLFKGGR
ncbi:MAG: DUF3551 domain-containing protein [Alphaproteobacteria bacterium]|nr:DUF3551 domain-containing protein [Alphaproteobacteria bacterium]